MIFSHKCVPAVHRLKNIVDSKPHWLSGFLIRSGSTTMSRHPYLGRYGAFEAALRIRIRTDPHHCWKLDPYPYQSKKFKSYGGSKSRFEGLWTLAMKAWRLKMEPREPVCRLVIADCSYGHHFDKEGSGFRSASKWKVGSGSASKRNRIRIRIKLKVGSGSASRWWGSETLPVWRLYWLVGLHNSHGLQSDVIILSDILISIFISSFVHSGNRVAPRWRQNRHSWKQSTSFTRPRRELHHWVAEQPIHLLRLNLKDLERRKKPQVAGTVPSLLF